jgi:transposase
MDGPECAGCRERDAVIAELRGRVAVMEQQLAEQGKRLADLESRLKTNSSNSSLPPSTDPLSAPKPPTKAPTGRKPGGQPGHTGHSRARLLPDVIVPHVPAHCERCQSPLSAEASPSDPSPAGRLRSMAMMSDVPRPSGGLYRGEGIP